MPVKRESGELRQDRRGEADFLLGAHVAPIAHLSATDFDRPHHGHGPHRAIQTDNLSGQQILLFRSPLCSIFAENAPLAVEILSLSYQLYSGTGHQTIALVRLSGRQDLEEMAVASGSSASAPLGSTE
jgi:hypothetical protein